MQPIRAFATAAWRFLLPLYAVVVVIQFFLAGAGVFGATDDFEPHQALGFLGTMVGSLLLLLLALVAWLPRLYLVSTAVLFVLAGIVQPALAEEGWAGALHAVNGLAILALSSWLASRAWRHEVFSRRPAGEVRGTV